jgi:superfamily II DNA or RNA helicase
VWTGDEHCELVSFEDASAFAIKMKANTLSKWKRLVVKLTNSGEWPAGIPKAPWRCVEYKSRWVDYRDFVGEEPVVDFVAFDEAKLIVQDMEVQSETHWIEICSGRVKGVSRPPQIPACIARYYKKSGEWTSWPDLLGRSNRWDLGSLRLFVRSLIDQDIVSNMSQSELYVIAQQNGLLNGRGKKPEFVKALISGLVNKSDLEDFANGIENDNVDALYGGSVTAEELQESLEVASATSECTESGNPDSIDSVVAEEAASDPKKAMEEIENTNALGDLPAISAKHVLDSLETELVASSDEHAANFLVSQAVFKMWKRAYLSPKHLAEVTKETARKRKGEYSERARKQFREELSAAKKVKVPAGFAYKTPDGKKVKPNLMQRHIATRVAAKRRFANWSGTGAGKTLSAILTSRIVDAELTIITCPSPIVGAWEREIKNAFPGSQVETNTFSPEWKAGGSPRYLVIGYGRLNTRTAASELASLMKREKIEFVVVDELHKAKQREKVSNRRRLVNGLCTHRKDLFVLGMTATPVVNDLREAVSLIEIVTGEEHPEINTKATVNNCITVFKHLSQIGIRWMPDYREAKTTYPRIDASHRIDDLRNCDDGSILQVERILTEEKIPEILDAIEDGTVIYTEFVGEGLVKVLRRAIVDAGWTVGMYTGSDKEGLQKFKDGEVNVLIGSSSIGTGVNDLQYRSKKLIIACLPWTSADNRQLIGRLVRQGQEREVEIVIPVTYVEGKDHDGAAIDWSWCQSRVNRIRFKQSISDAAVDGTVPSGRPRTAKEALKDLHGWMERLSGFDQAGGK